MLYRLFVDLSFGGLSDGLIMMNNDCVDKFLRSWW